jgi:hypothetical protein
MKGQAGKEAQIIQLQSALITAENKVGSRVGLSPVKKVQKF